MCLVLWHLSGPSRNHLLYALHGNPPPTHLRIAFVNTNGVSDSSRPRALRSVPADVLALQETHLTAAGQSLCSKRFSPLDPYWGGAVTNHAGVGFLVHPHAAWHVRPLSWPLGSACRRAFDAGRLHALVLCLGHGGRRLLRVLCLWVC